MKKLDKKTKNAILYFSTLLICAVICYISLQNFNHEVKTKNDDLDSLHNVKNQYLQETQLMSQYNNLKNSALSFSYVLPTQSTVVLWIKQIEIISQLLNLTENLSFEDAQLTSQGIVVTSPTEPAGMLSATITLSGTYDNIIAFIDALNKSYYYTQIDGITLSSETNGKIDATISLKLFISKGS